MAQQADHSLQVLLLLYVELDQRSGWADPIKLKKHFISKGVSEGRTEDALRTLKALQMVDEKVDGEIVSLKISRYGTAWLEKTLPMISREPDYEFSLPMFRSIKLVGPDEFYRNSALPKSHLNDVNWTKWGTIIALVTGAVTIAIMKGWL